MGPSPLFGDTMQCPVGSNSHVEQSPGQEIYQISCLGFGVKFAFSCQNTSTADKLPLPPALGVAGHGAMLGQRHLRQPVLHAAPGMYTWTMEIGTLVIRVCMSVCLYVCMSVCLYVCMSVCLYVCMSVCLYVSMSVCLYVCTYVRMYVCTYVRMYVCTYVRMYVCTYVRMYVCTYVRMYVCTYVRMYVCTYVCT